MKKGRGAQEKGGILQGKPGWSKLAKRAGLNFMARASCRSWRRGGGGGGGEAEREMEGAARCHSLSAARLGRLYSGISRSLEKKKKRADYLCPNRVVSLETGDAIISTGWVIIADQARVSVGDARRGMRQSLTNEGFYMCEVS